MLSIKFQGRVSLEGRLCFDDIDLLRDWLAKYPGTEIDITIGKRKEDKTLPQLGYLFGHVIPQIAEYTGFSDDEIYGFLKGKYLSRYVDQTTGKGEIVGLIVRSLSECSKEEVSKFIQQAVDFGAALGCDIYPPQHYAGE
jgi:hypothetical protein